MMRHLIVFLVLMTFACGAAAQEWSTFRGDFKRSGAAGGVSRYNLTDLALLWQYQSADAVKSSPAVADIAGDGAKEIVFGSDDRYLYAVDAGGRLLWRFKTGGAVMSAPTIADINEDGKAEVIFGSDDGNLYALDGSGAQLWNYSTGGPVRSSPAAENLDNVPGREIVFGSFDTRIYCLSNAGKKLWDYKTAEAVSSSPALFDIDGDGQKEVIIGSEDSMVYVLKYPPYRVWTYPTNGGISATPAVDRWGRVIIGSDDGSVYKLELRSIGIVETRRVLTSTGWGSETISMTSLTQTWNYTTRGYVRSSAAVGSVLGNGSYGAVVGSSDRTLYFLNDEGTRNVSYTLSKPVVSSPAIADFNGDNRTEIVFGSNEGTIYMIAYPGQKRFSFQTNGSVESSPAVADLEGDGTLEIIVGSDDGNLYVFGDRRSHVIAKGDAHYLAALRRYGVGETEEAMAELDRASEIYATLNYTEGALKCRNFFRKMDADMLLARAERLYSGGNLTEAKAQLVRIANAYDSIGDGAGINRTETLNRRIEADVYYIEAKYYFDNGLHYNATVYIEAARMLYRSVNDTAGLKKTEGLSSVTKTYDKADTYFDDAMKALNESRYDNARMLLGFARMSYDLAKNPGGLNKTDEWLQTVQAEETYSTALGYFNVSDYDKAITVAEGFLGSEKAAPKTRERLMALYVESLTRRDAGKLLDEAQMYYGGAYYKSASEYAENASKMFNQSGDFDGFARAQRLYLDSVAAQEATSGGTGIGSGAFTLIAIVALAIIVWAYQRRKQARIEEEMMYAPPVQEGRKPAETQKTTAYPAPGQLIDPRSMRQTMVPPQAQGNRPQPAKRTGAAFGRGMIHKPTLLPDAPGKQTFGNNREAPKPSTDNRGRTPYRLPQPQYRKKAGNLNAEAAGNPPQTMLESLLQKVRPKKPKKVTLILEPLIKDEKK
jgi:tetratricopeptide (TPR) repeat protein